MVPYMYIPGVRTEKDHLAGRRVKFKILESTAKRDGPAEVLTLPLLGYAPLNLRIWMYLLFLHVIF